jgi:hypothetical protein
VEYALPKLNLYFPLHDLSFSTILRERCTSKIEHFVLLILLHILLTRIVLHFPILLHILLVPIVLYFLLDNFIIFLALHVKVAPPKNKYLYFLSSQCVLSRVIGRTSLILRMILSFLQPFAVPNFNLCISCQHYVYFPILLFVYFLILILYTFLNIGKAYARKNIKNENYGLVYFPKFNICTSKTETRPCTSRLSMVASCNFCG